MALLILYLNDNLQWGTNTICTTRKDLTMKITGLYDGDVLILESVYLSLAEDKTNLSYPKLKVFTGEMRGIKPDKNKNIEVGWSYSFLYENKLVDVIITGKVTTINASIGQVEFITNGAPKILKKPTGSHAQTL